MNNISTVSFGSRQQREIVVADFMKNGSSTAQKNKRYERTPNQDEFRHDTKQKKAKKSSHGGGIKRFLAGCLAGAAVVSGANYVTTPHPDANVTVAYDSETDSLSDIAELYGVDEDVIKLYNDISEYTNMSNYTEIDIPSSFDYIQDTIEAKQNELYSSKLSDEEREDIELEIAALQEKQALQQQIATSYTDGDYIYIALNDIESDETLSQYQDGINVEEFKKLFDIKDGAIQKYNDLENCQWYSDGNGGGVIDFSECYLKGGDVIKIKSSAVTDEIDLSEFIEE